MGRGVSGKIKPLAVVLTALTGALLLIRFSLPDPLFREPYCTSVYARDGSLLSVRIAADEQWRFEPGSEVPEDFANALLTYEDKRFYSHFGIDLLAVFRALRLNIREGRVVSGASTLTMQVMRLAHGNGERSLGRKALETIQAIGLELNYSKQEILELYASHAPFGGNVVGLDAAAWRYYGKPPQLLSTAECALLAVLPNAPSLIRPGKGQDQLLMKRNRLLYRMAEAGFIDSSAARLATLEPLPGKPFPFPDRSPHLAEWLRKTTPHGKLWTTTIDPALQLQTNRILSGFRPVWEGNGVHNACILVAELESGEVVAYSGNVPGSSEDGSIDMIREPRSTGSILKPLLYSLSMDEGRILPKTLLPDIPTHIGSFHPENFNREFLGAVPADEALVLSLNIPAVRLLKSYGTQRFLTHLRGLGMSDLKYSADHYGLSLILGGGEVSPWQIATGYRALLAPLLSNHRLPVLQVVPDTGLLKLPTNTSRAGAVLQTLEAMEQLERPDEEVGWEYFGGNRLAWKTGTSIGFRDAWAVGITGRYVVVVWVGNASGEGRPGVLGVSVAAPVLFRLAEALEPSSWFTAYEDEFIKVPVCLHSGMSADINCALTDTCKVPLGGDRAAPCGFCRMITWDGKHQATRNCTGTPLRDTSWFVLPPAQAWYYARRNPGYRELPPWLPACGEPEGETMEFIYPDRYEHIIRPMDHRGTINPIICQLAHRNPNATVFWHLDDAYLGETTGEHHMPLNAGAGEHILTAIDEAGNRISQPFAITDPGDKR